jgi:hypothetical protein
VWFFDAAASVFQHPTDPGRLQWFRIVFGTVCILRFALVRLPLSHRPPA